VTNSGIRVPVLTRAAAAAITVSAVARGGWSISAATLLLSVPGLIEVYVRGGYPEDLPIPLTAVTALLCLVAIVAYRTSWITLTLYVVLGAVCVYVHLYAVLSRHSDLQLEGLILFNRPALALVIVGTASRKPLSAIAWGLSGFAAGEIVTIVVSHQLGLSVHFGAGPAITLAIYCAAYLGLSFAQRAQRGRVPDYLRLRQETRRIEEGRNIEHRATAVLHDTVLNDLSFIINGADKLDDRMRARLREDIETLSRAEWLATPPPLGDHSDVELRNAMMALVSDFQWRGLNVDITGDSGAVANLAPDAIAAAVGAVRACLENVLRHSGSTMAEVVVSVTNESVSWIVTDAGAGFDKDAVAPDRLGLRSSVVQRVESAGGTVRIWSAPGQGTSVLITLPATQVTAGADHGR
jgi:signal transduction histidine kinase